MEQKPAVAVSLLVEQLQPWHCKHCGRLLGQKSERKLVIGIVECLKVVHLNCRSCGQVNAWGPSAKSQD